VGHVRSVDHPGGRGRGVAPPLGCAGDHTGAHVVIGIGRGKTMSEFASRWITLFTEDFQEAKEELGELDRAAGDDDFAVNLASAPRLTERGLAELADGAGAADTFAAVSTAFLNTGGTSGPLLGMWFREIARAHRDEPEPVSAL